MITMRESGRTKAAQSEIMQDVMLVASFGFWAILLGFFPVLAVHTLTGS